MGRHHQTDRRDSTMSRVGSLILRVVHPFQIGTGDPISPPLNAFRYNWLRGATSGESPAVGDYKATAIGGQTRVTESPVVSK
jgi:hypothetical protein